MSEKQTMFVSPVRFHIGDEVQHAVVYDEEKGWVPLRPLDKGRTEQVRSIDFDPKGCRGKVHVNAHNGAGGVCYDAIATHKVLRG